jgi:hypothetical protein
MKKILSGRGKHFIWILFALCLIAGGILSLFTKINYDLTLYLPKDSQTVAGVEIMETEFGNTATIQVMVESTTIAQGAVLADRMRQVPGVKSLIWLGDVVNPLLPVESINADLLDRFSQDDTMLYTLTLDCDIYDPEADSIIAALRETLSGHEVAFRGEVLDNMEARKIASREIFKVLLIVIPLAIFALLIIGRSWFEPVLILGNLVVAIALNMGTNVFLGHVSYITLTMTMALQLALSFDYSLFLLHRYEEEREQGADIIPAIALATKKTFTSITGSAFTTIAGFLALLLMRYSIGSDIGLVLSKGIICSYLCAVVLLPVMLYFSANLLEKTKHRPLFHQKKPSKPRQFRGRILFTVLLGILMITAFVLEQKNTYLYGNASAKDPDSVVTLDKAAIEAHYGIYNPVVVLAPAITPAQEKQFVEQLVSSPLFATVDSLSQTVDASIPRELLPDALLSQYVSGDYTRIIVSLDTSQEDDTMYQAVEYLDTHADAIFDTYYLVGTAPATAEIRQTVTEDSSLVLWVTFLAIFLVVTILFRSLSIPLLLTLIIQGAVWINFAIAFVQQKPLLYIGFLIVSALQMGGTVDYGILLTNRYLEYRQVLPATAAIQNATRKSMLSIVTSSFVLASAGFTEGFVSSLPAVSAIGYLIGRGAILSAVVILVFLPFVLVAFDPIIRRTTRHSKRGDLA